MTFPTISYHYNSIPEAEDLAVIVDQKLGQLDKFLHSAGSAICEVEFEKVSPQHNGQVHRVEANLTIDGVLYRSDAVEESFEKAIDEVRDQLDKKLRRAKDKQVTMDKQAGLVMKEKMLGEV